MLQINNYFKNCTLIFIEKNYVGLQNCQDQTQNSTERRNKNKNKWRLKKTLTNIRKSSILPSSSSVWPFTFSSEGSASSFTNSLRSLNSLCFDETLSLWTVSISAVWALRQSVPTDIPPVSSVQSILAPRATTNFRLAFSAAIAVIPAAIEIIPSTNSRRRSMFDMD